MPKRNFVASPVVLKSEMAKHTLAQSFVTQFRSIHPLEIFDHHVPTVRAAARRALTLADPESILDGAMRYAIDCSDREANYIADPANWLNGRKWIGNGDVPAKIGDGSQVTFWR
jgi:hypothetical protein